MLKLDPTLIDESWPDEVIILNLTKGLYYSLRGAGIHVWPFLKRGAEQDQIIHGLQQRYTQDIKESICVLLDQMRHEGLLIETEEVSLPFTPENTIQKEPFEPPLFKVFSEMQDLLLLDPIHDTNEAGWPHKPV